MKLVNLLDHVSVGDTLYLLDGTPINIAGIYPSTIVVVDTTTRHESVITHNGVMKDPSIMGGQPIAFLAPPWLTVPTEPEIDWDAEFVKGRQVWVRMTKDEWAFAIAAVYVGGDGQPFVTFSPSPASDHDLVYWDECRLSPPDHRETHAPTMLVNYNVDSITMEGPRGHEYSMKVTTAKGGSSHYVEIHRTVDGQRTSKSLWWDGDSGELCLLPSATNPTNLVKFDGNLDKLFESAGGEVNNL
jgi:hypothetical protein